MPRLSTSTRRANPISSTPSHATPSSRTLPLTQKAKIDFKDKSVTENTRVSYPINHIKSIVEPVSAGPAAKNVIFLSAECIRCASSRFNPLPPEQTKYYFRLSGLHRQAGRYRTWYHRAYSYFLCLLRPGIPRTASYQVCRGTCQKKMEKSGAKAYRRKHRLERNRQAYLYPRHPRYHRRYPRRCHSHSSYQEIPIFDFEIPTELPVLIPRLLIPATPMQIPQNGKLRPRTSQHASSRTSRV